MDRGILSLLIIFPFLWGIGLLIAPPAARTFIKGLAILGALLELLFSLYLALMWNSQNVQQPQWNVNVPWFNLPIPGSTAPDGTKIAADIGIRYAVTIDGLSMPLLILLAGLTLLAVFLTHHETHKLKYFLALLFCLEGGIMGVFMATDLFLFYFFWELMLIPAYFLVGAWGEDRKHRAAISLKFVLYTLAGSLLMLAGIIALGASNAGLVLSNGQYIHTLELSQLEHALLVTQASAYSQTAFYIFLAFFLAFAIKAAWVPLHGWLPDTYTVTPVPVLLLVAGVMSKTGLYGFIRFCLPLFRPAIASFAPVIVTMAVVGIVYGALAALAQTDIKRLIAYSSISHLGFITLGIFALNIFNSPDAAASQGSIIGLNGAVLQMVNHGITTSAMFILVGILGHRMGTRDLRMMGGIARRLPWLGAVFLFVTLASLGLPGLNNFTGELFILMGAWQWAAPAALGATLGIILAAWYGLRLFQNAFHGTESNQTHVLEKQAVHTHEFDLRWQEGLILLPLLIFILWIGIQPLIITQYTNPAVQAIVQLATYGQH